MERQLLDIRLQMEALITEREGMIVENVRRSYEDKAITYSEVAFQNIAGQLNHLVEILRGL